MATKHVTLQELLHPPVINRVVSQLATPRQRFQDHYGTGMGGPANNPVGGKVAAYDIFNTTRLIAQTRPHGTGPGSAAAQPVGNVTLQMYRVHEKIHLEMDRIFRNRQLGSDLGSNLVDPSGQRYITLQEGHLAQKFRNSREFVMSRMFRGGFEIKRVGDEWFPVDLGEGTAGNIVVDFKVPADNKAKAGGIITDWSIAGTLIVNELIDLNAHAEELTGYAIEDAWISNSVAKHLLANTQVRELAGVANTVFTTFDRTGRTSVEGIPATDLNLNLRGIPWLTFHIYDAGLNIGPYTGMQDSGTFSKFIPPNRVIITPRAGPDWLEWYNGSEIVKRNVMDPGQEEMSMATWTTDTIDPAGIDLKAIDAGLPALYVPSAIWYLDVGP